MKSIIQPPIITRTKIITTMIALVLMVGCGFLYSRIAPYITGPVLQLQDTGNEATTSSEMTFSGNVIHGKQLSINGIPLMIDSDGKFLHHIIMQPGFNTFTINASDSFGHTTTITKNFVVQEQVYQSFARNGSSDNSAIQ